MSFSLTILGYNSALPTIKSNPTSQILEANENLYLIDCGESTQVQLRKAKVRFSKINTVFISHLHGDHVFGLIGLISSFQLLGKTNPLNIFGPLGIKDFIENQLKHTQGQCSFKLIFNELSSTDSQFIYEDRQIEVYTIPLKHRVYCNGYLFIQKEKLRTLNVDAVKAYEEIKTCDYLNIKRGKNAVLKDGTIVLNRELTYDPPPQKTFAFCSDTSFSPEIIELITGVDLLYHEATFLHDLKIKADATGHSTALEAGEIAKRAKAKKLIIGHFSNRYKNYQDLLDEAKQVFVNSYLPESLVKIEI